MAVPDGLSPAEARDQGRHQVGQGQRGHLSVYTGHHPQALGTRDIGGHRYFKK